MLVPQPLLADRAGPLRVSRVDARRAGRALHLDDATASPGRCRRARRAGSPCWSRRTSSAALNADPELDLEQYVRDQYATVLQPFVVIMRDGRTCRQSRRHARRDAARAARRERALNGGPRRLGRRVAPGPSDRAGGDRPAAIPTATRRSGASGRPAAARSARFAAIFVNGGMPVGRGHRAAGGPPFWRIVTRAGTDHGGGRRRRARSSACR